MECVDKKTKRLKFNVDIKMLIEKKYSVCKK